MEEPELCTQKIFMFVHLRVMHEPLCLGCLCLEGEEGGRGQHLTAVAETLQAHDRMEVRPHSTSSSWASLYF